uniref:Uncharacterized protein n=1 Tax=Trypanosoma congolense (strain IL3000) TaxID=1068625 RepID=G0UMN1_TRYCI|nr:hypothetical protein, unlikely [Trypanosoma congolense IL3000]
MNERKCDICITTSYTHHGATFAHKHTFRSKARVPKACTSSLRVPASPFDTSWWPAVTILPPRSRQPRSLLFFSSFVLLFVHSLAPDPSRPLLRRPLHFLFPFFLQSQTHTRQRTYQFMHYLLYLQPSLSFVQMKHIPHSPLALSG